MVHSRVCERPSPGNAKPNIGEMYSQATATAHNARRRLPSAAAPASQKQADTLTHASMRRKLGARMAATDLQQHERRAPDLHGGVGPAKTQARSAKASGMDEDINSASSMVTNSRLRMRGASGSNQLLTQQAYCQPSQTANHSTSVCITPIRSR
jgi:hypothetical protein